MDLTGIKKIEDLIIGSTILMPPERAEWMALLELMDDAQLLELESILLSAREPKVQEPKPPVPVPNQTISSPQVPKLAHITNFPNNVSSLPTPPLQIKSQPPAPLAPQKKLSGLSARIKQIMSEPELPSPPRELELPAWEHKIPSPPAAINYGSLGPIEPRIRPQPQPMPTATEAVSAPTIIPQIEAKPAHELKDFSITPALPGAASFPQKPFIRPPAPIQYEVLTKTPAQTPAPASQPPKKFLPQNLADLGALAPETLQTGGSEAAMQAIKNLSGRFGYHQVVFNIEKSPLYQNYLKTGAALLKTQGDFGQLEALGGETDYLTRAQFEMVADMLREIQGG